MNSYRYSGILAERVHRCVGPEDVASQAPAWWPNIGLPIDWWPAHFAHEEKCTRLQISQRLDALFASFGLEQEQPGAQLSLATSLALRHDPDILTVGGGLPFEKLFDRYDLDSQTTGSEIWSQLVMRIALRHVPGFQFDWPTLGKRGRYSDKTSKGCFRSSPVLSFVMIVERINEHLVGKGEPTPSPRKISKIFTSPTELHRISPAIAKAATAFRGSGNSHKLLSASAIEKLIRQMRTAREAVLTGTATGFQMQIVFELPDLLAKLAADEDRGGSEEP